MFRRSGWVSVSLTAMSALVGVAAGPGAAGTEAQARIERVSVSSAEAQADGVSGTAPLVSPTCRYVAYASSARNLVAPSPPAGRQSYLRDRRTGTTELLSVDPAGRPWLTASRPVSMSDDGRLVLLDVPDAGGFFLRDRTSGITTPVEVPRLTPNPPRPDEPDGIVSAGLLSATGRYLVFAIDNAVWRQDLVAGFNYWMISLDSTGVTADGVNVPQDVTPDGRFVTFTSTGRLVPEDLDSRMDVYVRDSQEFVSHLVSTGPDRNPYRHPARGGSVSADGRMVAFETEARLSSSDRDSLSDVYVRDLRRGKTVLVSNDKKALRTRASGGPSSHPTISDDGRFVSFNSRDSALVPGDTSNRQDVFVRDLLRELTTRVSLTHKGRQANGASVGLLSARARCVVLSSRASNLVPEDTNQAADVFVRSLRN